LNFRKTDYENYDYRKFWEDDKRLYEDKAERMALRTLLAGVDKRNKLIVDIGCGYGRLFNEYMDFGSVVLIDYSINNLKNARDRIKEFLGNNYEKMSSVFFIASDAASIPIRPDCADVVLTVRVVHHLDNPGGYFDEVERILKPGGLFILEFANKRNLKNIFRFFLGRMDTSPFNLTPSPIGETILNFHPDYISNFLTERNFVIKKRISVSNFRAEFLKKFPGTGAIVFFEKIYQKLFYYILLGPSIFLKCVLNKKEDKKQEDESSARINKNGVNRKIEIEDILICNSCGKAPLSISGDKIECKSCGKIFLKEDGIYNFKLKA
jgi:SAM-dependent methyltransferase/DNA-directed RNA polymerase subunit RPC12/RpoP